MCCPNTNPWQESSAESGTYCTCDVYTNTIISFKLNGAEKKHSYKYTYVYTCSFFINNAIAI